MCHLSGHIGDTILLINAITETQRLDAKNPDNQEDSSSARTSRRDKPGHKKSRRKDVRCEKIDKIRDFLSNMVGGWGDP
jgi:hypothetical protein